MRISRHDLRRRYSNSLVIDVGSQFSLRARWQATDKKFNCTFLNRHNRPFNVNTDNLCRTMSTKCTKCSKTFLVIKQLVFSYTTLICITVASM